MAAPQVHPLRHHPQRLAPDQPGLERIQVAVRLARAHQSASGFPRTISGGHGVLWDLYHFESHPPGLVRYAGACFRAIMRHDQA